MILVEPFDGDAADWDAFGASQPGWTVFHAYGWKRVMEDVLGHEACYLCARDGSGALLGVLPLVEVKSHLFGHYLVSIPFLNHGGPLGEGRAVDSLCSAAARVAEDRNADLLELRGRAEMAVGLSLSSRKITVVLDLPCRTEELWDALPSKVRSQIRRPRKAGCEIRFGLDQVDAFYRVFARHMRDLGTPVHSKELFRSIVSEFPAAVRIGCVYYEGNPIAAGFGFRWGHELEITWASALREHSRMAANMMLYWGFLEEAVAEGARHFDFGRCTPNGGTHRFKRQWGGRDVPLPWYQWTKSGAEAAPPSPEKPIYALGSRVWSRLPFPVANALGPRLVRLLP